MGQEQVEERLEEVKKARKSLKGLKDNDETEAIMPIGGDSYIKAEIIDTDKALVGLGGGYKAEKEIEGAVETLNSKLERINESKDRIEESIEDTKQELNQIQQKLAAAQQQKQNQQR